MTVISVWVTHRWWIEFSLLMFSPGHTVHCLLVDWRYHEAHRGHHRFVSGAVQDLPLEGLGVVEQSTFVSFMDNDLKEKRVQDWKRWKKKTHSGLKLRSLWAMNDCTSIWSLWSVLTSCCLKSQTAWMGSLPLMGVVGLRGFSWMMDLALLFKLVTRVLYSFSCSLSSCRINNEEVNNLIFFSKLYVINTSIIILLVLRAKLW